MCHFATSSLCSTVLKYSREILLATNVLFHAGTFPRLLTSGLRPHQLLRTQFLPSKFFYEFAWWIPFIRHVQDVLTASACAGGYLLFVLSRTCDVTTVTHGYLLFVMSRTCDATQCRLWLPFNRHAQDVRCGDYHLWLPFNVMPRTFVVTTVTYGCLLTSCPGRPVAIHIEVR